MKEKINNVSRETFLERVVSMKTIVYKMNNYQDLTKNDRQRIDAFVCHCYQHKTVSAIHPKNLQVYSICQYDADQMIGYAGIFQYPFPYDAYTFASITCFCIDEDKRKRGYGIQLLKKVEETMHTVFSVDFSIFTCIPALVPFYTAHSGWKVAPLHLTSGSCYDSEQMGLVVLLQLFNRQIMVDQLQNYGKIDLHLPNGMFI